MDLKSRQISLLRCLPQAVEGVSVQTLVDEFGVSRRTIYYDIAHINEWLGREDLGKVTLENQMVTSKDVCWKYAGRLVGLSRVRVFTVSERRSMTLVRIALAHEQATIPSLMDGYEVSRNTVITDIRELKGELNPLGINLASVPGQGYMLLGDEITIRKFIWSKLQGLAGAECIQDVRRFLQHTLVDVTKNDIDYYELCRSLIKQYELDLKTRCFLDSNGLEGMMIQVSWLRGLRGSWVAMGREEQITLSGTLSYRSVQCSVEKLKSAGIALPSEEILYITSLLLGIKTTNFARQREEDEYVSELAENLIGNFERVGCLTFMNKETIHEQLSHHIRPLYYRQKYGISVHNPLTVDVQKMYPMAFDFTRRAAVETGMDDLSDDELAYLTIYLSNDLDNKMLENGDTSATRVLLVGARNMSTITLVKERLFDACGICFEYDCAEVDSLHRWKLESYALVIALSHLPQEFRSDNMVETTPFFSEESRRQIYEVLRSNRIISRYDALIEGIVEIVGENIPDSDWEWLRSDKLHFELFRYFDERDRGFMGPTSVQLGDSHVRAERVVVPQGSTWGTAVLLGAHKLQEDASKSCLVERMSNIMASNKLLYYRMAPEVVVVRCPMQGDENAHVEAQIVLAPDGIELPDGKPARVVVCMATINRYSHWGTLYDIYQYFSSQEHVAALMADALEA